MSQKPSNLPQRLGNAMRTLREEIGLSQYEIARRMGLNASAQSQLGRYERGETIPRADTLKRYLDAVGATWSDLGSLFDSTGGGRRRNFSKRAFELTEELIRMTRRRPS